jgi:hypothetical protein
MGDEDFSEPVDRLGDTEHHVSRRCSSRPRWRPRIRTGNQGAGAGDETAAVACAS